MYLLRNVCRRRLVEGNFFPPFPQPMTDGTASSTLSKRRECTLNGCISLRTFLVKTPAGIQLPPIERPRTHFFLSSRQNPKEIHIHIMITTSNHDDDGDHVMVDHTPTMRLFLQRHNITTKSTTSTLHPTGKLSSAKVVDL